MQDTFQGKVGERRSILIFLPSDDGKDKYLYTIPGKTEADLTQYIQVTVEELTRGLNVQESDEAWEMARTIHHVPLSINARKVERIREESQIHFND